MKPDWKKNWADNVDTIRIVAEYVVHALRELLAADPQAAHALFESRVPCNEKVETDTRMVPFVSESGELQLGPLGLLNAIVGTPHLRLYGVYTGGRLTDFYYGAYTSGDHPPVQGQHRPELQQAGAAAEKAGRGAGAPKA